MEKIIIAVGSNRRPKLNAVREALELIGPSFEEGAQFEIIGVEVPSGVRHTPLSREDIMKGACQRAEALVQIAREKNERWQLFIGLEGGLDVMHENGVRQVFLESWAYVSNGKGCSAFGQSGAVMVPETLAGRVVDQGIELAEAIDAFASGHGIRDAQGAWGVLTRNLITRQDAFRIAVVSAFAPFFNREMYSSRAEGARA
jgi:inosine/xanthosine triphosphatase